MTFKSPENSYEDWLKRQPEAVQNKMLGNVRASLWRDGKLAICGNMITGQNADVKPSEQADFRCPFCGGIIRKADIHLNDPTCCNRCGAHVIQFWCGACRGVFFQSYRGQLPPAIDCAICGQLIAT